VSLPAALQLAGALDRMNAVNFDFDLNDRYTFWSGIAGGFFLALSYFGTDQSQVQRYLSGRSVAESRLGLLFNGVLKIPDAVRHPDARRAAVRLLLVHAAADLLQHAGPGGGGTGGERRRDARHSGEL
jgi:hypothetical protein